MRLPVHIIVIDEDDARREENARTVDRIGHRCTAVDTVAEIISRRGRLNPDLLLVSEAAWGDGCREYVRDMSSKGGLRVLILGNERTMGRTPELLDQGSQGVLMFPLSTAELDRAVEALMIGPPAQVVFTGEVSAVADEPVEQIAEGPKLSEEEKDEKQAKMREQIAGLAGDLRSGKARLSEISPVAMELQGLCASDEPPSLGRLVQKIEQDPNLATSVLKASNTAAYRGMPAVLDLKAAGRRLGTRRMGEVAQMEAIKGAFTAKTASGWSKILAKMWRTTVTTAHACRMMADRVGGAGRGEIYSLALFHNLGEILVIDLYRKMGEKAPRDGFASGGLREDMDKMHADLGALLLRSWGMPTSVAAVAMAHHDPSKLPSGTPLTRHAWLIGGTHRAVVEAGFAYKKPHEEGPPLEVAAAVLGVPGDAFREVAELSMEWWQTGRE
ncbi:MAG: HDOD domain-containing protein [Proteobacteria bacterium]|nr:HDOD domain-containing protein [Pseudomonadota bacterium]